MLAGLSYTQLWVAYYALGGERTFEELKARLMGEQPMTAEDYDVAAVALNEHFSDMGLGYPLDYSGASGS